MASLDAMTSMLPGALAAKAHMPLLPGPGSMSIEDGTVTIERSVDGFTGSAARGPASRCLRDRTDHQSRAGSGLPR